MDVAGFFLTGAATKVVAGAMVKTAVIVLECASTTSATGSPRKEKTMRDLRPPSGIVNLSKEMKSFSGKTRKKRDKQNMGNGW
ncbi:hypothetical protein KSC_025910 [Ktedonobacter sp. SOSP1-52]|nr:hypothetical protein [Ktedonobacter sp. SOSP1-52]GHO63699.1 hypothetical protein KSC_025910 [Ktedonobacter sp. SOSP1-52]